MKKSLALASSFLVLVAGLMRCSGDNTAADAGDSGTDVVRRDVNLPDTAVPIVTPAGTQLAASNHIQVFGVTTDDQVIFADNDAGGALFAVDSAGGTAPTPIAAPTVSSGVTYIAGISGKVVFVWEGISTAANAAQVGTLHVWKKGGSYVLADNSDAGTKKSCASAGASASADGAQIMFAANSDIGCTVGDVVGENSDGTAASTLATGVDFAADCSPAFGFAGGTHAVTATCANAPGDGGTPAALINSYDTAWTPTLIVADALNFWASDSAGDALFVGTPTVAEVFPIAGGNPLVIAMKNLDKGFAYMWKDGTRVLYSTSAGDLFTASIGPSPTVTQLQASVVQTVRSLSADDKYLVYSTSFDAAQFGSDLFLTSTTTAGTPTTLVSGTTGALFGLGFADDFTADSQYALYITNVDTTQFIGDLTALPVGGGTPNKIASGEWLNISTTGSKIVFNDNCQNCGVDPQTNQVVGTADIRAVDVSTTNTPTLLQAGADPQIEISYPRTRVIYTYSSNPPADDGGTIPAGNGLYSVPVP